jgi:hypothetical protein
MPFIPARNNHIVNRHFIKTAGHSARHLSAKLPVPLSIFLTFRRVHPFLSFCLTWQFHQKSPIRDERGRFVTPRLLESRLSILFNRASIALFDRHATDSPKTPAAHVDITYVFKSLPAGCIAMIAFLDLVMGNGVMIFFGFG